MSMITPWAADVKVSMPPGVDAKMPVLVDLGGFGFTAGGLAHNVTDADVEFLSTPFYAPDGVIPG